MRNQALAKQDDKRSSDAGVSAPGSSSAIATPRLRDSNVFGPSLQPLRPSASRAKRLSAVPLPNLQHSDILLPLQPTVERERLRPASFPNIKAVRRPSLRLPTEPLVPVKLVTRDSLAAPTRRKAAAASAPSTPASLPEADSPTPTPFVAAAIETSTPAGASIPEPKLAPLPEPIPPAPSRPISTLEAGSPALRRTQHEPLWHSLFAPSAEQRAAETGEPDAAPFRARQAVVEKAKTGFDWGDAGNIEIDDLTDSKTDSTQLAPVEPAKRIWFWQAIEGVFLSRTFARSLAVVTIALFASTFDMPWRDWMQKQAARVRAPVSAALAQLSKPIEERAAFFIVDDFTSGVDHWLSSTELNVDPAGWLTVSPGLALHGGTTQLEDYRFDFDAKIQSNAVGWLVRAPDESNYYAFKLRQQGSERSPVFRLLRFAMLDGEKTLVSDPIKVPSHLARSDDFNRISVRVVGDHVTTLLNGWGVDFWTDDSLARGGVGLIADAGEQALIRKMTVSGNDDTWGLLLYGAVESMQLVQEFFREGSQNPAMLLFHRPLLPRQAEAMLLTGGPANRPQR